MFSTMNRMSLWRPAVADVARIAGLQAQGFAGLGVE